MTFDFTGRDDMDEARQAGVELRFQVVSDALELCPGDAWLRAERLRLARRVAYFAVRVAVHRSLALFQSERRRN